MSDRCRVCGFKLPRKARLPFHAHCAGIDKVTRQLRKPRKKTVLYISGMDSNGNARVESYEVNEVSWAGVSILE